MILLQVVEAAVHEVKSVALQAHILRQLSVVNYSLATIDDAWVLQRLPFRH